MVDKRRLLKIQNTNIQILNKYSQLRVWNNYLQLEILQNNSKVSSQILQNKTGRINWKRKILELKICHMLLELKMYQVICKNASSVMILNVDKIVLYHIHPK
jgi:hypothetical protein